MVSRNPYGNDYGHYSNVKHSKPFSTDDYYNWIRTKDIYSNHAWVYSLPGFHAWLSYKDSEKYKNDYRKNTGKTPAYVTYNKGYYNGSSAIKEMAIAGAVGRKANGLFKDYSNFW